MVPNQAEHHKYKEHALIHFSAIFPFKKLLVTHDYDQLQTTLFSLEQHPSSEEKLITDSNNASFTLTELDKLPRMIYNVIF